MQGPSLSLFDYSYSDLRFTPLLPNQLGAGFAATGSEYGGIGCRNVPIARIFGPSIPGAGYIGPPRGSAPHPTNLVFAASWIDLRVTVPPTPAELQSLKLQGVMELLVGLNRWSTGGDGIVPRRKRKKRNGMERLNSFAKQGTAYIRPPSLWRYADTYNVSGVVYHEVDHGVFESEDGRVLNVTGSG